MTTPDDPEPLPKPSLCCFCAEGVTVFYIPATNFKIPICKPCLDTKISHNLAGKPW